MAMERGRRGNNRSRAEEEEGGGLNTQRMAEDKRREALRREMDSRFLGDNCCFDSSRML